MPARRNEKLYLVGALVLGVILSGICFVLFQREGKVPPPEKEQENLSSTPSSPPLLGSETNESHTKFSSKKMESAPTQKASNDIHVEDPLPEDIPTFDPHVLYEMPTFVTPDKFANAKFADAKVEVVWDSSCDQLPEKQKFVEANGHFQKKGLDGRFKVPGETHVVDFNQYYRLGTEFIQLSALWQTDSPATYKVQGLKGPSPYELSGRLEEFPKKSMTQADALRFLQEKEKELQAKGGIPGARSMIVASSAFDPKNTTIENVETVEYRNNTPFRYSVGKVSCFQQREFRCKCAQ